MYGPEHYKAIMHGEIPLDGDNEGLEAVELDTLIMRLMSMRQN